MKKTRIDEQDILYGLVNACPLEKCDPNCPFTKFRELSLIERIKTIKILSEEEKLQIIKKHYRCIERFENNYFHKPKKMKTQHYISWWNVENLFDEFSSAERPEWLQKTLQKELKGWSQTVLKKSSTILAR